MKILFIGLHALDRVPSQRFRFEQYLGYLNEVGIETNYSGVLERSDYKYFYKKGHYLRKFLIVLKGFWKRYREISGLKNYDIVFVQREAFMLGTTFFERQYAKWSSLVYDLDDAIWLNASTSKANRILSFLKRPSKTSEIISISRLVFAGNQYLADYSAKFNEKVVIVPTTIDTNQYLPAYNTGKDKVCIGWSGSFSTIAHFTTCIDALRRIREKYGDSVRFKVIGDGNYKNEELGIIGMDWREETEVKDLQDIDIGIMPLPEDEWSKGKCGLKGLQYMALSIPTIMSPVGVNVDIITDGENGFLANNTEEWVDKISRLIDSKDLRIAIGKKGRQTIVSKYSVDAVKHMYFHHFKSLITNKSPN